MKSDYKSLDLVDLDHQEFEFELSTRPGKKYWLRKWSLKSRIWARQRFGGDDVIQDVFRRKDIEQIAELAFFQLKEGHDFESLDEFFDSVVTGQDSANLVQGLLTTIGLSQPALKKMAEKIRESKKKPQQKQSESLTGAESTTPSPPSTATP